MQPSGGLGGQISASWDPGAAAAGSGPAMGMGAASMLPPAGRSLSPVKQVRHGRNQARWNDENKGGSAMTVRASKTTACLIACRISRTRDHGGDGGDRGNDVMIIIIIVIIIVIVVVIARCPFLFLWLRTALWLNSAVVSRRSWAAGWNWRAAGRATPLRLGSVRLLSPLPPPLLPSCSVLVLVSAPVRGVPPARLRQVCAAVTGIQHEFLPASAPFQFSRSAPINSAAKAPGGRGVVGAFLMGGAAGTVPHNMDYPPTRWP